MDSEQVAELLEVVRLGQSRLKALDEAVAGQHGGIDAVRLGECPEDVDGFQITAPESP